MGIDKKYDALFQFHNGSIKRRAIVSSKASPLRFNSTMVRLKDPDLPS